MRIISKFHDFYDSIQRTGMDREVVYVRETKEITINQVSKIILDRYSSGWSTSMRYLGFCGHIYKCYVLTHANEDNKYFWDFDEFKAEAMRLQAASSYDFGRRWWKSSYDQFNEEDPSKLIELFHEHQVPIFEIRHSSERNKHKLILNPCLKEYKFQTLKDPYSTYQDIFQYVAGVLNSRENKMVEISDEDKIHKHGFDKWSFRKMPNKK